LDSLVKERLTGAIILVVLIVLLVPELLSGPSRSAPAPQAVATSSEEPPLRSYTIDLADESHSSSASSGNSAASPQANGPAQPAPITEPPQIQQAGSESTPIAEPAPGVSQASPPISTPFSDNAANEREQPRPQVPQRSPATQRPQADKPPAQRYASAERPSSSAGSWVVQIGVFANHANADRLAQELRNKGFHTLVSESGGGGRSLWRVRAGPVAEKAAAEQLNARLRAAGHAGSVLPK